jgi:hypothetical protein
MVKGGYKREVKVVRGESNRNGHRGHPVNIMGSSLIILVMNSNSVNKLHKVVGVS